jgi:hypothetical protein
MRADDFRRIALGMQHVQEASHMGHPDFRANGRIFATLYADPRFAMVKLTPEQQKEFVFEHPAVFAPENGAWGRQGCTRVTLASSTREIVGQALTLAWRGVMQSKPGKASNRRKSPSPTKRPAR